MLQPRLLDNWKWDKKGSYGGGGVKAEAWWRGKEETRRAGGGMPSHAGGCHVSQLPFAASSEGTPARALEEWGLPTQAG